MNNFLSLRLARVTTVLFPCENTRLLCLREISACSRLRLCRISIQLCTAFYPLCDAPGRSWAIKSAVATFLRLPDVSARLYETEAYRPRLKNELRKPRRNEVLPAIDGQRLLPRPNVAVPHKKEIANTVENLSVWLPVRKAQLRWITTGNLSIVSI